MLVAPALADRVSLIFNRAIFCAFRYRNCDLVTQLPSQSIIQYSASGFNAESVTTILDMYSDSLRPSRGGPNFVLSPQWALENTPNSWVIVP